MKKKAATPAEPYDYEDDTRGLWAAVVSGKNRIILTEHPRTLLSMYAAGVLAGKALADAQALAATEEGRTYLEWRTRVTASPAGKVS